MRTTINPDSFTEQLINSISSGTPLEEGVVKRLLAANAVVSPQDHGVDTRPAPFRLLSEQLKSTDTRFFGNDNIAEVMAGLGITPGDLIADAERAMEHLLDTLVVDWRKDHNSEGTAKRVAKMLINETWAGRFHVEPDITDFPNASNADQLIVAKRLRVESVCSHHHQNIRGYAWIGVLPHKDGKVIGLSKFARVLRHYARRPQIQEELTVQVADHLWEKLRPRGVAVMLDCEHQCMSVRGVHEHESTTSTTHLLGEFLESNELRQEFLRQVSHVRSH